MTSKSVAKKPVRPASKSANELRRDRAYSTLTATLSHLNSDDLDWALQLDRVELDESYQAIGRDIYASDAVWFARGVAVVARRCFVPSSEFAHVGLDPNDVTELLYARLSTCPVNQVIRRSPKSFGERANEIWLNNGQDHSWLPFCDGLLAAHLGRRIFDEAEARLTQQAIRDLDDGQRIWADIRRKRERTEHELLETFAALVAHANPPTTSELMDVDAVRAEYRALHPTRCTELLELRHLTAEQLRIIAREHPKDQLPSRAVIASEELVARSVSTQERMSALRLLRDAALRAGDVDCAVKAKAELRRCRSAA